MFNGIKTILFTTNLSKDCVPAFDLALILAQPVRSTTKSVLRRSRTPVMIVPVDPKEKATLQDLSGWSS